jgi:hypothetical protein
MKSHATTFTLGLTLSLAALLGGCSSPRTLNVEDHSAPIFTARAVHRFGGLDAGGAGLEFEAHSARGEATQTLAGSDWVSLGNRDILGPVTLASRARTEHVQLTYNHLLFAGRPMEMEWFAGATASRLKWDTRSFRATDLPLSASHSWFGPVGGIAARIRLAPSLALEGRFSGAIALRSDFGSSRANAELALAWSPLPQLQLRAGIAESDADASGHVSDSDLSLRVRGPFAGLTLAF